MGRVLKRLLVIIAMMLVIALVMLGGFALAYGCALDLVMRIACTPDFTTREVGDFSVRFYSNYCEIEGTTAQGNAKRFLIIPEYIDGLRVKTLGWNSIVASMMGGADGIAYPIIESEILEKIYFESDTDFSPYLGSSQTHPNLKKIICPTMEKHPNRSNCNMYYPYQVFVDNNLGEHYRKYAANVSFYKNYEDGKSKYYWTDDCDYGGKIEYVPKDPTRDGYMFQGWYKEAECINEWNFEEDRLPEENREQKDFFENGGTVTKEVTVYQETILYAKWVESNE